VKAALTRRETPRNYRSWPGGKDLPDQLDCWAVQTGTLVKEIDYGLVSTPQGFEDSPDAEVICSGINSKGPTSVAIGRHANLMLWGFEGDPTQMTEGARRLFLTAIAYMKRFDGHGPLTPKVTEAREDALLWFGFYGSGDKPLPDFVRKRYSAELWKLAGDDFRKLEQVVRANLEYLRCERRSVEVTFERPESRAASRAQTQVSKIELDVVGLDEDAQALGVSTRSLELLDAIAAALQRDEKNERARRLLARYLPEQKDASAASLASWLGANRRRLFLSDVGGYRWFVDTRGK